LYASGTGATPGRVLHVAKRAFVISSPNGISFAKPLQSGSSTHLDYVRF